MQETTEMDFEAAIKRLEQITNELERDGGQLDEALALFEEGVKLVKLCSAKLDAAEQKVRLLISNGNGGYDECAFTKTE